MTIDQFIATRTKWKSSETISLEREMDVPSALEPDVDSITPFVLAAIQEPPAQAKFEDGPGTDTPARPGPVLRCSSNLGPL